MGNSNNKFLSDPEIQQLRSKFSDLELIVLHQLFEDLSMRDYGIINKESFLLFFPLTGLWGERLFDKFDMKHTGHIHFTEFIKGLASCCKSTEEERIKFLFSLYDIDNDGYIEKKEMVTMLYNYPKNHIKFITEELAPDKGDKLAGLTESKRRSVTSLLEIEDKEAAATKVEKLDKLEKVPDSIILETEIEDDPNVADEGSRLFVDEVERDIKKPYSIQKEKEKSKLSMIKMNLTIESLKKTSNFEPYSNRKYAQENRKRSAEVTSTEKKFKEPSSVDNSRIIHRDSHVSASMISLKPGKLISNSTVIVDQSFVQASTVNSRVKEYASFMFRNFEGAHARGKISFEEFKEWLQVHPMILKVFDETFHQEIWGVDDYKNGSTKNGSSKNGGFHLNFHHLKVEMSGILWKKGKKSKAWKSRYFELRGHFLFYYTKKEVETPNGVFFLDGCYIDETNDYYQTKKYGFVITHKSPSYEPHYLYCSNKQEFDEWMSHLKLFQSTSIHELYTFHDKIGTGKFSIVYRAVCKKDNKEYAIKVIDKNKLKPEEKEFLLLETSVMKVLDHPHVIKLIDTIETKSIIYIITEIVKDGDLFDFIINNEFLEEYDASLIMKQLLNSFNYLHGAGVIHRDIKPENILISLDEKKNVKDIKIIDFGFAKFITPGTLLKETCGTPNYVAPEVLKGTGYNKKADIWSLGIIMYLMLRGQLPFDSNNVDTILKNTLRSEIVLDDPHWARISKEGKDLLMKFLQKDPAKRIEIADALKHPWIQKREELKKYIGVNRVNTESPSQSFQASPIKGSDLNN